MLHSTDLIQILFGIKMNVDLNKYRTKSNNDMVYFFLDHNTTTEEISKLHTRRVIFGKNL